MIRSSERPSASGAVHPNTRSAPAFQYAIVPAGSAMITASASRSSRPARAASSGRRGTGAGSVWSAVVIVLPGRAARDRERAAASVDAEVGEAGASGLQAAMGAPGDEGGDVGPQLVRLAVDREHAPAG